MACCCPGGFCTLGVGLEGAAREPAIQQEGQGPRELVGVSCPCALREVATQLRTFRLCAKVRSCTGVPGAVSAAALMNAQPR